ncbi:MULTISPECIES: hypothetical protein [Arthrobacter]|nr:MULTISPECIES: hypothetical protein [Arthrobacter]
MGDPLLTWASSWLAGHGGHGYVTECSRTCRSLESAPRHVHARWVLQEDKAGQEAVDVLIAEGWWANLFDAPSASRISNWITPLIWGVGWRGFLGAALIVGAVMVGAEWFSGDWGASLALGTVFAMTLCILVALLPAALLLVGKLPGKIGDASAGFLNFLVLWVGDVMVYQQNPRNAFAAKQKIGRDLRWLTARTESTVISAHSLGSILTIDALSESSDSKVKFLATFGCPIKLLKLLKRGKHQFLSRLNNVDRATGWANFYDPFDFIGGRVDNKHGFPYNLKVDNGRGFLGAHGGYPDNAEQFQDALYRLIIFDQAAQVGGTNAPGKPGERDGKEIEVENKNLISAFRSRWWRFFNGTAFMLLSLPSAMAGAYMLVEQGWAGRVADLVNAQKYIPGFIRDTITAAAVQGDPKQQAAGSVLICLAATAVLAVFVLWLGHLVLRSYEARSEAAVAAGGSPSITRFKWFLAGLWAIWLLTLLWAWLYTQVPQKVGPSQITTPGQENTPGQLFTLIIPTAAAMAIIGGLMFLARHLRHFALDSEAQGKARLSMVGSALGDPFIRTNNKYQRGAGRPRAGSDDATHTASVSRFRRQTRKRSGEKRRSGKSHTGR